MSRGRKACRHYVHADDIVLNTQTIFMKKWINDRAAVNDKKRLETLYLEEARPASDLFPDGRLEPHEGPRLHSVCRPWKDRHQVTETVRQKPRAEASRLAKAPDKARELYGRYPLT
jgi:hypothetical protein